MRFLFRRPLPRSLRVLVEVGSFDKGGLEKVVLDSTLALHRVGVPTLIVSVGPLGELAAAARAAGLHVEALDPEARERSYARLVKAFRPSLAVSHFSTAGYRLFAKRGVPIVSFIHNVYAFMDAPQRERFAADDRMVARYIAVSPNAARYASARLGIPAARITTIPNGLDLDEYARRAANARPASRVALGIESDDYVFLNVASYNLHKGHYVMAAAMRRLLAGRRDIRIVCVGNPVVPAHVEGLRTYLREQGLDRHMLLPGYTPRVEDWFAMADAFLLPSFIEGWSIAMNEAMSFARPMIMTDTGGAAEVIEDGDTGLLIPNEYGDVTTLDGTLLDRLAYDTRDFRIADDLAGAMARFADAREQWAAAGLRGRAKLQARYGLSQIAARHRAVFDSVAEAAR
ncbi:MAG TPA: glycosyltransferase family 4 protein [Acetobacteraceae bacterium]|nr:glycosyltransferase family 4 protein [Acetobacteraceae bacterium]